MEDLFKLRTTERNPHPQLRSGHGSDSSERRTYALSSLPKTGLNHDTRLHIAEGSTVDAERLAARREQDKCREKKEAEARS